VKKLAIIGTGIIAHDNYKAIVETGKAEIVALCNRTYSKGVDFAQKYGIECPVYSDYREMVDDISLSVLSLQQGGI
jgi:predicted dehydrogenase